ncbi:MAG: type II 3-dehydroquinate dehydratase [Christensenellaceae bacterium]|nr:type II 3-dehydroquinate dehydratase [Christensenellaceae bacterium]
MKHFLVMNGPNLNMTGIREKGVYGAKTLEDINADIAALAEQLGVEVEFYQSNHEGALIDRLHAAHGQLDGIILNAGAYTHYSYAIRDAIAAIDVPVVEVHISNVHAREEFRKISVIAPVCKGTVAGFGPKGYAMALRALAEG